MNLPVSYLTRRVTLEEAVSGNLVGGVPFGAVKDDWQRLLDKRRDGDQLWTFEPPPRSFRVWGIALVRDGQVISTVITAVD